MKQDPSGRYVIESELGKGGMGDVYKAHDTRLGRRIALKIVPETEAADSERRDRLRHEARAAAALNHPSIAALYDFDEQGGLSFITYEYVEGRTLDRVIAEEKLTPRQVTDIGVQVAAGLAYAHGKGILHRDIKPQNIMIAPDGTAKILDFGLAKRTSVAFQDSNGTLHPSTSVATMAGAIVGTVQYMSPEQIAGEALDGRTDVFSLGVVLYEMASGRNPFKGQNFASTVGKIMALEPPPLSAENLDTPPSLQEVVARALRKNREERYASARELHADLERIRSGDQSPKPSGQRPTRGAQKSVIPRAIARLSLILLQVLYLAVYAIALYYHADVLESAARLLAPLFGDSILEALPGSRPWVAALLVSACSGIAIRLYLLASVGFDDHETGRQFQKLLPVIVLLDEVWALSPLLLIGRWPAGLAIMTVAILAYLPFTQRNLMVSAYPRA